MLNEQRASHPKLFIMSIKSLSRISLAGVWLMLMVMLAAGQGTAPASQADATPLAGVKALLAAGKTDEAIAAVKALPKSVDEAQLNHLLGLAYYQKSDFQHAVEHLTLSIKQAKEGTAQYRQAAQLLGMAHYFLGHSREATTYLELVRGWSHDNTENAYV